MPDSLTHRPGRFALAASALLVVAGYIASAVGQPVSSTRLIGLTPEQAEILSHMSLVELSDGQGGTVRTIRISGVNVQVVNGLDSTETANGVGNLIVGYQELGNEIEPDNRTGSHYLVVGRRNNFTAYGGVIVGESNVGDGQYAAINGGRRNRAEGPWSAVSGGGFNRAAGPQAVVAGGSFNWAGSESSSVLGGSGNFAIAAGAGGAGSAAVVVGGFDNRSKGQGSVIVGGRWNETTANYSSILAGTHNTCFGDSGGGGSFCAIVGGESNTTATTHAATVGGGLNRSTSGPHDWAAGSLFEDN